MVSKVLHVIPSVGPLRGGPSVMVRQLAHNLAKAGVETHVATTDDNAAETLAVPHGVPVSQDGVTYWFFPRQLRSYTVSWPLASWLADRVADFDVVHIHALFSFATLPAAYFAHRRGVPYIVRPLGTLNTWGMTHRRPWLKKLSFRLLESRVVKHAALMHYTSEQERREAELLDVRTSSVVIPNAVSDGPVSEEPVSLAAASFTRRRGDLRRRLGWGADRPIVLFLSRLDEKKGLDLLLRAFVTLRARVANAVLVAAGDGPPDFVTRIKAEARALGLGDDAVLWTGFLAGDEKAAVLADADVFVLPSYSENFGIAVAEAMSARLPVVVSDQVGIHRQIAQAGAGLVVQCDSTKLADALETLLTSRALRAAMGAYGQALVRRLYSDDAVTRQLIEAYNQVADGTTRARVRAESVRVSA